MIILSNSLRIGKKCQGSLLPKQKVVKFDHFKLDNKKRRVTKPSSDRETSVQRCRYSDYAYTGNTTKIEKKILI